MQRIHDGVLPVPFWILQQIDPQFLDSDSDSDSGEDTERFSSPHTSQQRHHSGDLGQAGRAASSQGTLGGATDHGVCAENDVDGPASASASAQLPAAASAAVPGGEDSYQSEIAVHGTGRAGPSSNEDDVAAASLLLKYRVHGPRLSGHKHSLDEYECEDNCEECHIVDGMPIKVSSTWRRGAQLRTEVPRG